MHAVDVCICTYQRSQLLLDLLHSLAVQRGAPSFRVLVVDNHPAPVEGAAVAQLALECGLHLDYVHAPAANISIARNAGISHTRAALLAFVDDDQIADPHWLAQLCGAIEDCDVVFGPVRARYPAGTPTWIERGDFHAKRMVMHAGGLPGSGGYTANVLMRRSCIAALRFEPRLGRTGGEDTLFFAQLARSGARLSYSPLPLMEERVDPQRCSLSWLCRRSFGSGQAHARAARTCGRSAWTLALIAAVKALYCLVMLLPGLLDPAGLRWRKQVLRGGFHLGAAASALGMPDVQLYGAMATAPVSSPPEHDKT